MYQVFEGRQLVLAEHSVEECVQQLREFWNESDGPQCFTVVDEGDSVLAVVLRPEPQADPDLCLTVYPLEGRQELHACRYVFRGDGVYSHTQVVRLDPARRGGNCEFCPAEGGGCCVCRSA